MSRAMFQGAYVCLCTVSFAAPSSAGFRALLTLAHVLYHTIVTGRFERIEMCVVAERVVGTAASLFDPAQGAHFAVVELANAFAQAGRVAALSPKHSLFTCSHACTRAALFLRCMFVLVWCASSTYAGKQPSLNWTACLVVLSMCVAKLQYESLKLNKRAE